MADENDNASDVVRPTSQVDLERRLEADHSVAVVRGPHDDAPEEENVRELVVEGNDTSAYVGTDQIYQNYADDTHKPYPFEGVEGEAVKLQFEDQFAVGKDKPVEGGHTLGTGSDFETVATSQSGSDYEPEIVDREAVRKEAEADNQRRLAEASGQQNVQSAAPRPVAKKVATPSQTTNE